MSWSVNVIGTVDKINEFLDEQSQRYSGQSKKEYDAVLPHLKALIAMNIDKNPKLIKLEAGGHASEIIDSDADIIKVVYSNCSVRIEPTHNTYLV